MEKESYKNNMLFYILLPILLFCVLWGTTCCVKAQATTGEKKVRIILSDNTEMNGVIIKEDSASVVIRTASGVESMVKRSFIAQITYDTSVLTVDRITEEKVTKGKDSTTWSVGATIGTPAGLNIRFGFGNGKSAFHFSGGYWGNIIGLQINPMLALYSDERTFQYFSGMIGTSHIGDSDLLYSGGGYRVVSRPKNWTYLGLGYVLHSRGFLLEAGLSAGLGSFSSPQLMLQIGYVHQF